MSFNTFYRGFFVSLLITFISTVLRDLPIEDRTGTFVQIP